MTSKNTKNETKDTSNYSSETQRIFHSGRLSSTVVKQSLWGSKKSKSLR